MFLSEEFAVKNNKKCKLVLPQKKYAASLYNIVNSERSRLGEYLPWIDMMKSPLDEEKFIEDSLRKMIDGKVFVLIILVDNEVVGCIDLHEIKKEQSAEIGYWISKEVEGLGVVTNSVKILENYALEDLKLRELIIKAQPSNIKSSKVAKRLNYKKEGREENKEVVFDIYKKEL